MPAGGRAMPPPGFAGRQLPGATRAAAPSGLPPSNGGRGGPLAAGPAPVPPPPPSNKPPRSPRAALEPERVPSPRRRSTRVRHPLVIVGNAIFTVLVVFAVAV